MNPWTWSLRVSLPLLALALGLSGCGKKQNQPAAKPGADVQAKLDAIRQAGQPVKLEDFSGWYPDPPAGDNAAPLYGQAFAALTDTDVKAPGFLAQNRQALSLLHEASAKSRCRYSVDMGQGMATALPHLAKIKKCAQLLALETEAQAAKGRMDLAAQSAIDGLRLVRSLDQEPLLISQMVRFSSQSAILSGLAGALKLKPMPEEALTRAQTELRDGDIAAAAMLARALASERCTGIAMFDMTPKQIETMGQTADGAPLSGLGTLADLERYSKSPVAKADLGFFLDGCSNLIAIAAQPFPACLEAAGQWDAAAAARANEAKTNGYKISAILLGGLGNSFVRSADCVGQTRAALAALAIERYRLANRNALPDSLEVLVPKHLATVPEDPFDGKPIRYKKLPKGYVTYSIGRNRTDDGGTPKPTGASSEGAYDLTFMVPR